MKKSRVILLFFFLNCFLNLNAQTQVSNKSNVQTLLWPYKLPNSEDHGPMDVTVHGTYYFVRERLGGTDRVHLNYTITKIEYLAPLRFLRNGVIYRPSEMSAIDGLGSQGFDEVDITGVNIKMTAIGVSNAREFDINKNWRHANYIGETSPTADLNNLSLDLVLSYASNIYYTNASALRGRIDKLNKLIEDRDKYKTTISQADAAFNSKDWLKAKSLYESATRLFPNENYPKEQLDKIKKIDEESRAAEILKREQQEKEKKEKEEEAQKVNDAIKRGDEKMAAGDLEGAKAEYNEARKLDPENPSLKKKEEELASKTTNAENLKEDETIKKQEEAESQRLKAIEDKRLADEAAAQKIIEDEKARKARQDQYYSEKQQVRDANTNIAIGSAEELLLLHFKLAQIIYGHLEFEHSGSIFSNDNWRFTVQTGYSISSIPMIFNSNFEDFDGNYYTYTQQSEDLQSGTLDLNGGLELWPMYGKKVGVGFHGHGGIGHGFLIQSFTSFAQGGMKAYLGFEKVKFYGEYTLGYRSISKTPWIEPQEFGYGKLKYNYHRIFTGLRFSIPGEIETKGINITVGPLFENQSFREMNYLNPITIRWNSGVKLEVDIENRLNVFAECFFNYSRSGDIEPGYNQIFRATGAYFRIGAFRNFDFFGESPYINSVSAIKRMKKNRAFTGISFLNPTFNWLADKKGNYASKDVKLGWNLAFEKDIKLFPNINFTTGAIVTINSGGKSYNLTDANYTSHSLAIPLGIRLYLESIPSPYKYWISGALKNDFSIKSNVGGFNTFNTNRYTHALSFGGGMDYMLGENTCARVGVSFDFGAKSVFSSSINDIRKRALCFQVGFIF